MKSGRGRAVEVHPARAPRDAPVEVFVTGLGVRERVTLRARARDEDGTAWESWVEFVADVGGTVDVGRTVPLAGTYARADAMGLFWSMLPANVAAQAAGPFSWRTLEPVTVEIAVEGAGGTLAVAAVERLAIGDKTRVVRRVGTEADLVGTLFHPPFPGPHPAVLVLSGSAGGLREDVAALLATRGFAALALAYFGVGQLPTELVEVPLEYLARALTWLRGVPAVDPHRVAVLGSSKGGELALLLAANYPGDVSAAVCYVPSCVVWQGISFRPEALARGPRSSWTKGGEPVPFLRYVPAQPNGPRGGRGRPLAVRPLYERALENGDAVAEAAIPLERIRGPVLMVSGTDDQVWPSTPLCNLAMERLEARGDPYHREHLCYEGAGHLISAPYLPSAASMGPLALGGNPEANAFASSDSWERILGFLRERL